MSPVGAADHVRTSFIEWLDMDIKQRLNQYIIELKKNKPLKYIWKDIWHFMIVWIGVE